MALQTYAIETYSDLKKTRAYILPNYYFGKKKNNSYLDVAGFDLRECPNIQDRSFAGGGLELKWAELWSDQPKLVSVSENQTRHKKQKPIHKAQRKPL